MRETGIDRPGFIGATRPINGHVSAPESLPFHRHFSKKKKKHKNKRNPKEKLPSAQSPRTPAWNSL